MHPPLWMKQTASNTPAILKLNFKSMSLGCKYKMSDKFIPFWGATNVIDYIFPSKVIRTITHTHKRLSDSGCHKTWYNRSQEKGDVQPNVTQVYPGRIAMDLIICMISNKKSCEDWVFIMNENITESFVWKSKLDFHGKHSNLVL